MEIVSAAVVRVAVGLERIGVVVGGTVVAVDVSNAEVAVGGTLVGVGASVDVDGTLVEVAAGCVVIGVSVGEGKGLAPRLISNKRTVDQAPLVPPAVRALTRHQKRRSLVNVCEV